MRNILKNLRARPAVLIGIVLVLLIGGYYGVRALANNSNGQLKASGTIETVDVNISSEVSGKVKEVLVDEGQTVKAGAPLLVLDDTLLKAQQAAAQAGLNAAKSAALTAQAAYASAQSQYDIAMTTARSQAKPTRLADWAGRTPDYFDQPKWYFTQAEQTTAAEAEVQAAQANLTAVQAKLDSVVNDLNNASFVAAETRLSNARLSYLVARQVQQEGQSVGQGTAPSELDLKTLNIAIPPAPAPVSGYQIRIHISQNMPNQVFLYDASQVAYNAAVTELSDAQTAYNKLLTSASAEKVLRARATLAVAKERYEVAQDRLSALQTGDVSPQVTAAAAVLDQAKNAAQQGQDAVEQAQANLDLLNAQLGKQTVYAPIDGMILTRSIEPGEIIQPGSAALTMGNISQLTITVYVPEDRYGQISLGEKATVKVDSFPGSTFTAAVTHISDQAEFTPRNVQTVEGRSSTVYAVKLKVDDPQGKLKPGMPADVTFLR
jgi:HlyD family secretion protein